jgi:hypothetical protein
MAFPTATVTQGSGLTINTLPNAGQATMANSLGVAIASDQSAVPVTALNSGSITNPTSVLTRSAAAPSSAAIAVITTSSPYITWPGANPPVNGQGFFFQNTAPTNITVGTTYWVRDAAGNSFNLSATLGGAAIVPGSAGTFTLTLEYKPNDLIASSSTTPVVPSFAIATSAGGVIIPRIRLSTLGTQNVIPWGGAMFSVNLWSAAPTYTGGDAQLYAPARGAAGWLANFLVTMTQIGDGAYGNGVLTGANQMALKLASGTSVFWDLQILNFNQPFASQAFTLTAECLN